MNKIRNIAIWIVTVCLLLTAFLPNQAPVVKAAANISIPNEVSINLTRYFSNQKTINFTVAGTYSNGQVKLSPNKNYSARVDGNKISIYENSKKIVTSSEFNFSPSTYNQSHYFKVKTSSGATYNYLGKMRIWYKSGTVGLRNTLPLEDYLKGVVPREMSAYWPLETLKAQAVAARTYVVNNYHPAFTDTTSDQVYDGYIWGSSTYDRSNRAVNDTAGQVLVDSNGSLVSTFYSSSNGGKIFSQTNSWGTSWNPSYFQLKDDPFDLQASYNPYRTWSFSLKKNMSSGLTAQDRTIKSNIENWIKRNDSSVSSSNKVVLKNINSVSFNKVTNSSQVAKGKINVRFDIYTIKNGKDHYVTTRIKEYDDRAYTIRSMIGSSYMRSPYVTKVENQSSRFVVHGGGWGHNIGMSQYGARVMGDNGFKYDQILAFYYPNTTIRKKSGGNVKPEKPIENIETTIILSETTRLYNMPQSGTYAGASISPTKVTATGKLGSWYLINTWLGPKWIQPKNALIGDPQTINVRGYTFTQKSIYDEPLESAKRIEYINPQNITITGKWSNWYRIKTWLGDKWIKANNVKESPMEVINKKGFTTEVNLYNYPWTSARNSAKIGEQSITINAQWENWYRINTWLGQKWIPKSSVIEGEVTNINERRYILDRRHLHNSFNDSTKRKEYLENQYVTVLSNIGDWFKVKTWLGDKWIKNPVFLEDKETQVNYTVFASSTNLYNAPKSSAKNTARINQQNVNVVAEYGSWLKIKTWLGDKWIPKETTINGSPEEINERLFILDRRYLYNSFSDNSKRKEYLEMQYVTVDTKIGEWYKVKTWIGDKWVKNPSFLEDVKEPLSDKAQLLEKVNLYNSPKTSAKRVEQLNPQQVMVVSKYKDWYEIRTWVGNKWIPAKDVVLGEIINVNEKLQLTTSHRLHDKPNPNYIISASVGAQEVTVTGKIGDKWYRIKTWLGDKWIEVK